ncbi:MAG: Rsp5p-dependent ubiquitination, sorting of cargo proteins at the multivesicular body [Chrysothrix sp. TS-e1954]|nr:MAG: Rsp5p-dependent ubiquitination, sorting of cargo proteins at the multivesicular body [Chrysothrix sp. TS-e1954]
MAVQYVLSPTTLQKAHRDAATPLDNSQEASPSWPTNRVYKDQVLEVNRNVGSTGKGILIGMLSAFGSALIVALILAAIYFFRYTSKGRIFLDRIGRPGEFDDEQAFAKEEAEALEEMDDIQRIEYMRAKAFVQANPPESAQTDISFSQYLAIQEKGVSAWEFEPELEIANCFVEGRTEIEFFDSECSVQSNLPIPRQNDVYYWEAKIYDKPDTTNIGIGVSTKPYPLFRMPGYHKTSVAFTSLGDRRFNQPFKPTSNYATPYVRGDVVGCGYRPRTGTVFFTRNGRKLDDITHTLKTQNLFPTVGATGPCSVHVNFGQMGFVFIEANVKKWGLAPMTGSLAPPPPYGSEAGSILLEGGQHGIPEGQGWLSASAPAHTGGHGRSRSAQIRLAGQQPTSPGPQRSPTDISLTQLSLAEQDAGEGTSSSFGAGGTGAADVGVEDLAAASTSGNEGLGFTNVIDAPPPEYESPTESDAERERDRRRSLSEQYFDAEDSADDGDNESTPRPSLDARPRRTSSLPDDERRALLRREGDSPSPPIPSYDAAVGSAPSSSRNDFR